MRDFAKAVKAVSRCVAAAFTVGAVAMTSAISPLALAQDDSGSAAQAAPLDEAGPPAPALLPVATTPVVDDKAKAETKIESTVEQKQEQKEEPKRIFRRGESHDDTVFGSHRIRLMWARPTFRDNLKYYDALYGRAKDYPEIAMDWFAWDWYATMGLGLRVGYYSDDGNAAQLTSGQATDLGNLKSSDIQRDANGPTTMLLIPLQVLFTAEITPFPKKWLVLDGWVGWEHLYYQETRNQKQGSTSTNTGSTTTKTAAMRPMVPHFSAVTVSTDKTLTNTGWRNATVVGGAANIRLNAFDEMSAASIRNIGIGGIYLSPYLEWIKTLGQPAGSSFSFGRTVMGLAFTFETIR
jgi:hypothetical protein